MISFHICQNIINIIESQLIHYCGMILATRRAVHQGDLASRTTFDTQRFTRSTAGAAFDGTQCATPPAQRSTPWTAQCSTAQRVRRTPPLRGRRSDPHVRRRGVPRHSVQRHGVRSPHAEVATLLRAASPLHHTAESREQRRLHH